MLNFIVNPGALRGKNRRLIEKIGERLRERGTEHRFFYSLKAGDAVKYAKSLTEAGETEIVAVGGDGTLNEVLCGLRDPSCVTLGLIPAGTGNDFAGAVHIPKGLKALDYILNGEPTAIDYIECGGGRRSINIAGLGIDVDILKRCARKKVGGRRGKYFASLLASLCTYRGLELEVAVHGETAHYNALLAVVCNGSQFGGGIPICPAAAADDGVLDLLVVDCPKRAKIPGELLQLMRGKMLTRPISHHILCDSAVIRPVRREVVQYDGELYEADALEATLVSGKLHMYRG